MTRSITTGAFFFKLNQGIYLFKQSHAIFLIICLFSIKIKSKGPFPIQWEKALIMSSLFFTGIRSKLLICPQNHPLTHYRWLVNDCQCLSSSHHGSIVSGAGGWDWPVHPGGRAAVPGPTRRVHRDEAWVPHHWTDGHGGKCAHQLGQDGDSGHTVCTGRLSGLVATW